jgi:formylglycine-generating enzyme required for sulfatase activity
MRSSRFLRVLLLVSSIVSGVAAATLLATPASALVTMDWVPIGNPGNAPDPTFNPSTLTGSNCYSANCGQVNYTYYISKYDVTNAQYAEFLNAVDPSGSNSLGLYDISMSTDVNNGGITNTGSAGSVYQVKAGFANDPVTYVSFYDALRFANWLNNGQGNASTETGAYTLLGGTPTPSNGPTVTRNPGAISFLPSENEWYKAAYYNPATSSYFAYPFGTNTEPTCAAPGAIPNTANCRDAIGHVSNVGAYTDSASPYGTFDQGGNVFQWNEQSVSDGSYRGFRGGMWIFGPGYLAASAPADGDPAGVQGLGIGFRVASLASVNVQIELPWSILLSSPVPVSVTILGSNTVDVTKIDGTTLRFGPNGATPVQLSLMDVNQDGYLDLVAAFGVQDAGLGPGDTPACLQGKIDDQVFQGCTSVVVANVACGLGVELAPILPALLWLRGRRRRKPA